MNKALPLFTRAVKTWQHIEINIGAHFKISNIWYNFSGYCTAASSGLVSARKSETTTLSIEKEQDGPRTYKSNTEALSRNHSCCGKVGI